MGCGSPKEKIEDEMMKAKMERIEIQMERINQLHLLKNTYGKEIKTALIPDYIDINFLQDYLIKRQHSSSTIQKEESCQIRNYHKRSKTNNVRKKTINIKRKRLVKEKL